MSYQKNTWYTGDTITAEKLNNIENGIQAASQGGGGGGGLPSYTSEDANKSLTVEAQVVGYSSGSPVFEYVPGWKYVIPQATDEDVNKVLAVESTYNSETYQTEYNPVWKEGVPSLEYAYTGDVLVVNECSGEKSMEWRQVIPDFSSGYYDGYYLRVNGDYLEWDGSIQSLNLDNYYFPSYYEVSAGDVLVVSDTSGSASIGAMLPRELIKQGLEDWIDNDGITQGYALVANPSGGTPDHVIWQEIIPDWSQASDGDVLTIVNGVPTWQTPSS